MYNLQCGLHYLKAAIVETELITSASVEANINYISRTKQQNCLAIQKRVKPETAGPPYVVKVFIRNMPYFH